MKIIHFADLHLGMEKYGRIDPATGLSSRLADFLKVFDELVEYAIGNKIDLVLFCGDAYKTREPTQTQQRELAKRINQLASNNIPVVLVIGNHDMPNAIGRATATEIFDTLAVKNVYVASRPKVYKIPTAGGMIQIAALPWLRRSALANEIQYRGLGLEEIRQIMGQKLTEVISSLAQEIDTTVPAILAAHLWVTGARVGSESSMTIGQDPSVLVSSVALPAFDYVALGHIHRRQVLAEKPPVVYSGSLERVDFTEEDDEKGFFVIDFNATLPRRVSYEFHQVKARRFLTINVTVRPEEADPTAAVLKDIGGVKDRATEAIVRVNVKLPASLEGALRGNDIREAMKEAYSLNVTREVERETRRRLPLQTSGELPPLAALKAWMETQHLTPERQNTLLEHAEKMIQES